MSNSIEMRVRPIRPKQAAEQQLEVYIPIGSDSQAGIVKYDNEFFVVRNGTLFLKEALLSAGVFYIPSDETLELNTPVTIIGKDKFVPSEIGPRVGSTVINAKGRLGSVINYYQYDETYVIEYTVVLKGRNSASYDNTFDYFTGDIVIYTDEQGATGAYVSLIDNNSDMPDTESWQKLGAITTFDRLSNGEVDGTIVQNYVDESSAVHQNNAIGVNSVAFGEGTVANSRNEFVVGQYNEEIEDEALFVVGSGYSDDVRRNALTVTKEGATKVFNTPYTDYDVIRKIELDDVTELIPEGATVLNKLVSTSQMETAIEERASHFRGNFENWSTVPTSSDGYLEDDAGSKVPTQHDYIYVGEANDYPEREISGSWKFVRNTEWSADGKNGWKPEVFFNQNLTEQEIAALHSGITETKVTNYDKYLSNDTLEVALRYHEGKLYGVKGDLLGSEITFDDFENYVSQGTEPFVYYDENGLDCRLYLSNHYDGSFALFNNQTKNSIGVNFNIFLRFDNNDDCEIIIDELDSYLMPIPNRTFRYFPNAVNNVTVRGFNNFDSNGASISFELIYTNSYSSKPIVETKDGHKICFGTLSYGDRTLTPIETDLHNHGTVNSFVSQVVPCYVTVSIRRDTGITFYKNGIDIISYAPNRQFTGGVGTYTVGSFVSEFLSSVAYSTYTFNSNGASINDLCMNGSMSEDDVRNLYHNKGMRHDDLVYLSGYDSISIDEFHRIALNHSAKIFYNELVFHLTAITDDRYLYTTIAPDFTAQLEIDTTDLSITFREYSDADSQLSEDSTRPVQNKVITAELSSMSNEIDAAVLTANNAESIARGKSRGRVFDTLNELNTWLANQTHVSELNVGDVFYIRATDEPDYWWDGTQKLPLESEKVDLTEYAKTTGTYPNMTVGSANNFKNYNTVIWESMSDFDAAVNRGEITANTFSFVKRGD